MRLLMLAVVGAASCIHAVPAAGGWIEYIDIHRGVSLTLQDETTASVNEQSGFWFSAMLEGNQHSIVSAVQISKIKPNIIEFGALSSVATLHADSPVASESYVDVEFELEQAAEVGLEWDFSFITLGNGQASASFEIAPLGSGPLFDFSMAFEESSAGSTEVELSPGIYLVSMLIDTSVDASGPGAAFIAGGALVEFMVPVPGAIAVLILFVLFFGTRRR